MIKKVYTTALLVSLAVPALSAMAAAESDVEVHGAVEGGVQGVDVHSNNDAKFQEFRDLDDGFIGSLFLDVKKEAYYLDLEALNPGRDDQFFDLGGGRYGDFKYNFFYDEMPHNYSFNALSFYRGLGTNHLILPADPTANPPNSFETSTDTWSLFDYSVQHKKYGGEVEFSFQSPFFFGFGAERRQQDGTRPFSIRENIEVPLPISYATNNLDVKTGYLGENISVKFTGYLSSFENDNNFLIWEDPSPAGNLADNIEQNAVLDPDNDFGKVSGDFSWRNLPLKSTLAIGANYANLSSDVSAAENNNNADTVDDPDEFNSLNRTTFDGDIDYTSVSAAVVSMPLANFDTKVYYRYLDKENNSSRISYLSGGVVAEGDNAQELLSFTQNTAGIDLGYRLPWRTKLDGGYEFENIDRSTELPAFVNLDPGDFKVYRYDNPESTTNDTIYAQIKNSSLDWLTSKLKYKHLERDSDFTGIYDPYNNVGILRFDAANKSMDEVKLGFELYPVDWYDIGLDFTYQNNDYDDARENRTDDTRKSVYLDMTWHAYRKMTLSVFGGLELVDTDANRITDLTVNTSPVYAQTVDDDFWTYGITLNAPNVVNKLSLNFSYQFQKSDGSVIFDNSVTNTSLVDINDSDDYTKSTFEAKAIYDIDPKLALTVGYLYERFNWSDIAYENYQYILNNADYYSGAYFDVNYTANVGYLTLVYKF